MANNFSYEVVAPKLGDFDVGESLASQVRTLAQNGGAMVPIIPPLATTPDMPPGIPTPGFPPLFPARPTPPTPYADPGQGQNQPYVAPPSSGMGVLGKILIAAGAAGAVVVGYRIYKRRHQKNVSVAGLFGLGGHKKKSKKSRR